MKFNIYIKSFLLFNFFLGFHFIAVGQENTIIQIEKLTKPKSLLLQIDSKEIYKQYNLGLEGASAMPDSLVAFNEHPFLNGLVNAYQNHRPFTFSPDMFWVLISQGFARNVANHSEELREKLVGFEGKKELIVKGDKYNIALGNNSSDWEKVFPEFAQQIEQYTGEKLNDVLIGDFSTTTPVSKIVSQITVMEAFKNYFDYKVTYIGCGLPYVTLEGTLKDWQKLRTKTEYLSQYKLAWWTKELLPILDKLIEAKKGKIDKTFWKNTVKFRTEDAPYGPFDHINGWITKFFPFDNKGNQRQLGEIVTSSSLASEIVKVPFILEELTSKQAYKMEFWGGFIGCTQNATDFGLKPELGWAVNNVAKQKLNLDTARAKSDLKNVRTNSDQIAFDKEMAKLLKLKEESHLNNALADYGKVLELKNVDEIPDEVFNQNYFRVLVIRFRSIIKIPDKLTKVRIDKLYLFGTISENEKASIIEMMPKTKIVFNTTEPINWF